MAGITLVIEVDDKGIPVIRRVADESKKFFKEMEEGPQRARGPLASFSEGWVGLTAKIGLATAAFYAAKRMIWDTAKEIASFGSDMIRTAETMGMTVQQFQEWRYVARLSDVELQSMTMGFRMLSQNMLDASKGTGEAKDAFARLGISVKDPNDQLKSITMMIPELASRLSNIQNPTERLATTMKIFGSRSGEAFDALLRQGGPALESMIKEFHDLGFEIDEGVLKRLAYSEDAFKRLSFSGDKLKAALGPAVEFIADKINLMAGNLSWILAEIDARSQKGEVERLKQLREWEKYTEGLLAEEKPWYTPQSIYEGNQKRMREALEEYDRQIREIQEKWKSTPPVTKRLGESLETDPYKILYGQTEEEMKTGIERARVSYKGWMDAYINEWDAQYGRIEEVWERVEDGVLKHKEILVTDYGIPRASEESERNLRILQMEEKYRDQVTEAINRQNEALIQLGLGFELPTEEQKIQMLIREADARGKMIDDTQVIYEEIMRLGEIQNKEIYGAIDWQKKQIPEWQNAWTNAAEGVANIWSSNFSIMRRTGEDFGDWFKNIWLDMADYAIGQIFRIAVNYALLGNMAGKYQSGQGIFGILFGSLFKGAGAGAGSAAFGGAAIAAQGGYEGIVNRPTLFMAGEVPESVSIRPTSKPSQEARAPVFNITITAVDARSFVELADRNPQAIVDPFLKAINMGDRSLIAAIRRTK